MASSAAANAYAVNLSEAQFDRFRALIYRLAGIALAPHKRPLVAGRLHKRLRHYGMTSYDAYFELISRPEGEAERQMMVDLLTTNETYFFRESNHFDFIRETVCASRPDNQALRMWSAASSSGEEVYSLAMVAADRLGKQWSLLGSDISTRVLETARQGLYPISDIRNIPQKLLQAYCLKGVRSQAGFFLIDPELKQNISFRQINLHTQLPHDIGRFHLIMLRNVMIYFDNDTKRQVVARLRQALLPGGYFIIGHSESLHGIDTVLKMIKPSIFRLPPAAGAVLP